MAKTIEITIGERMAAAALLNAGQFNNATLAVVLDDIKKFAITEEEWVKANLKKTPTDEEVAKLSQEEKATTRQTWTWDETFTKTIDLDGGTVTAITEMVKQKSDEKKLTLQDAALLTLVKKLEA